MTRQVYNCCDYACGWSCRWEVRWSQQNGSFLSSVWKLRWPGKLRSPELYVVCVLTWHGTGGLRLPRRLPCIRALLIERCMGPIFHFISFMHDPWKWKWPQFDRSDRFSIMTIWQTDRRKDLLGYSWYSSLHNKLCRCAVQIIIHDTTVKKGKVE